MLHPDVAVVPGGADGGRPETDLLLLEELRFLAAWEDRRVPWPSATLRVRQIRRVLRAAAPAS